MNAIGRLFALPDFLRVIKAGEEVINPETWKNRQSLANALAVLLEREKRNSESEEVCQVAVQRKPKNAEAWFRLGNLRLARNAADEAKEAFKTCTALKPEWHEARLNLALAHNEKVNGQARAKVLLNLGREDRLDHDRLRRLVLYCAVSRKWTTQSCRL